MRLSDCTSVASLRLWINRKRQKTATDKILAASESLFSER